MELSREDPQQRQQPRRDKYLRLQIPHPEWLLQHRQTCRRKKRRDYHGETASRLRENDRTVIHTKLKRPVTPLLVFLFLDYWRSEGIVLQQITLRQQPPLNSSLRPQRSRDLGFANGSGHLSFHNNGFVCQNCGSPFGCSCLRTHVDEYRKVASIAPVHRFCLYDKTDFLNTFMEITAVNHTERCRGVEIEANTRNPFFRGLEVCLNLDGELGFDVVPHSARRLECDDANLVARGYARPIARFIVR